MNRRGFLKALAAAPIAVLAAKLLPPIPSNLSYMARNMVQNQLALVRQIRQFPTKPNDDFVEPLPSDVLDLAQELASDVVKDLDERENRLIAEAR